MKAVNAYYTYIYIYIYILKNTYYGGKKVAIRVCVVDAALSKVRNCVCVCGVCVCVCV